jgi:hypothetical protein
VAGRRLAPAEEDHDIAARRNFIAARAFRETEFLFCRSFINWDANNVRNLFETSRMNANEFVNHSLLFEGAYK